MGNNYTHFSRERADAGENSRRRKFPMQDDEKAIRDLVMTWQSAAAAGDLPRLLTMMAEDVVFLTPGQPPMRGRDAFATNFRTAVENFRIESSCQIQEIRIA